MGIEIIYIYIYIYIGINRQNKMGKLVEVGRVCLDGVKETSLS